MNKLHEIFSEHRVIVSTLLFLLLILFVSLAVWRYKASNKFYITAKFSESAPLFVNMNVYYKGYKIGKVKKIYPSDDYKYTMVKIVMYPKNPKLPEGLIARDDKEITKKDYIDLMSPDPLTGNILKKGSIIDGQATYNVSSFFEEITNSGIMVPLLQNFSDALVSVNKTSNEIKSFFSDSRGVLKDNRQNLKQTTSGLSTSSKALTKFASRLNNTITDVKLTNTTSNIDRASTNILTATENINRITSKVNSATENLDQTRANIDSTICEINGAASNIKTISGSLREALGQRFAGLKIFFGKPGCNQKCPSACCPLTCCPPKCCPQTKLQRRPLRPLRTCPDNCSR